MCEPLRSPVNWVLPEISPKRLAMTAMKALKTLRLEDESGGSTKAAQQVRLCSKTETKLELAEQDLSKTFEGSTAHYIADGTVIPN